MNKYDVRRKERRGKMEGGGKGEEVGGGLLQFVIAPVEYFIMKYANCCYTRTIIMPHRCYNKYNA